MSDHRTPGPPSTKTGSAAPETVPSRSAACAAVTDPASRTTGAVAGPSPEPAAACSPAAPYRPATPATSAPRIDHTHSRFPTTVPCHARSSDDTVDSLPAPALDPPALHGPRFDAPKNPTALALLVLARDTAPSRQRWPRPLGVCPRS